LTLGDDVWVGEGVWLHTMEDITIEDNVCISQGASVTTGSHLRHDPQFHFDNAPVRLRSGCWIGVEAMIMRGVTVGVNAVVGARAVAYEDVPDDTMLLIGEQKKRSTGVTPAPAAAHTTAAAPRSSTDDRTIAR
jgi:putative colanic acid biosynthesis acetyltransferase WcaF